MRIDISCPHCGYKYEGIPDQAIGRLSTCKHCGDRFRIEAPSQTLSEVYADGGRNRMAGPPPLTTQSQGKRTKKQAAWIPLLIGCGCLVVLLPLLAVVSSLLIPAVQSARESSRRAECVNNLKQIGLGMHNYESEYNSFPSWALKGKTGKSMLSWRVMILPYIEQQELYNQFHLDEPWDSANNIALLPFMPEIYRCPSDRLEPGFTNYTVIVGEQTMFPKSRPSTIAGVEDGTSNTIMVVESTRPVEWTKPDDILIDENATEQQITMGSKHPGGLNVLFSDGSVKFIRITIDLDVLKALITRNGEEVISADSY